MEQFSQESIGQRVHKAIERFALYDSELLSIDCNERSITHRLAMYLQDEFEGWDVDCEYNRDHHSPDHVKRLYSLIEQISTSDTDAKTVFPDIIVHHRGTSENLLVIEVKKSRNPEPDKRDKQKLQALKEELGYRYALFLRFNAGSDFQEGQDLLRELHWV